MTVRAALTAAALTSTVLATGAPAPAVAAPAVAGAAAPVVAAAAEARPAAPTALTPAVWFVDQTRRRTFTVRLDRPLCHGGVYVYVYDAAGTVLAKPYRRVTSCRTSVAVTTTMPARVPVRSLGAGSVTMFVKDDVAATGEMTIGAHPFFIKQAAVQSVRATRCRRYVTLSGATRRYVLSDGRPGRWAPAPRVRIRVQRLVGSRWTTIATTRADARGVSRVRLAAPHRATYRLLYPGSVTQGSAASARVVR